jgi:hypothetical protein
MFRRGGSVAYGTGITSGLDTPRAKYADGPDEEGVQQEDIELSEKGVQQENIGLSEKEQEKINPEILKAAYDIIKQKTLPSKEESLTDFLTSFGASAGDPTELQSVGSALGKTLQRYQTVQQPKIQAASKYGAQAALASLKGMSKSSQTALYKNAQLGVMAGEYKTIEEGIQKQIQAQSFQKLPHPEVVKTKIIKGYEDDYKKINPNDVYASNKAEMDYLIRNAKKLPGGITEEDLAGSKRYLKPDVLTTSSDGKIILNPDPKIINEGTRKQYAKEINKVFINPVNKKFYRFKGDYFEPIG